MKNMKGLTTVIGFLIASLFILTFHKLAFAGPIVGPVWVADNPGNFEASFAHGPFTGNAVHALGPFVGPNGNWEIVSLKLTETAKALPKFPGDVLVVEGALQHLIGPHNPSNSGGDVIPNPNIFNFGPLTVDAGKAGPLIRQTTAQGTIDHPLHPPLKGQQKGPHHDIFTATLTANLFKGQPLITGYEVKLEGKHHTPEPSTLILIGIGLAGLTRYGRKRLLKKV